MTIAFERERESNDYTNCNKCSWNSHQGISTKTEGIGNSGTSGDCSNYNILKIGQNTEEGPGELRLLAVTQSPLENHQLMLI